MEKRAHLLVVQIDHIPGEVLGFALERLMEIGANNVQLIPTITKKTRPGNLLLVDADAENEENISMFLARELKVTGYHRVDTEHVFHEVSFVRKKIKLRSNGKSESVDCDVKLTGDRSRPLSVDVEHDFLVSVQERVRDRLERPVALTELRTLIESRLREPGDEITIDL